jgi:DNA mismatch repair protein MutS2
VANASVEFDVETLSPTYRLSIGLPGRSNALAIAARLGLPATIIEQAREFLGTAGVEMESLLEDLQADRRAAADERFHLSMERAEAEYQRREVERERARIEDERDTILADARATARRELEALQAELARMRVEVSRAGLSNERLGALRHQSRDLEARLIPVPARRKRRPEPDTEEPRLAGPLQVGDAVLVRSVNQRGELIGLSEARGEAEVQLGALKTRVPVTDLERLSRRQTHAADDRPALSLPVLAERVAPDLQLDLRGQKVEDVLPAVDQYLNDAYLSGMPFVRLLHGKGTGALRQAVRAQLAHHPLVRSYTAAANAEGGEGVTVATLAH